MIEVNDISSQDVLQLAGPLGMLDTELCSFLREQGVSLALSAHVMERVGQCAASSLVQLTIACVLYAGNTGVPTLFAPEDEADIRSGSSRVTAIRMNPLSSEQCSGENLERACVLGALPTKNAATAEREGSYSGTLEVEW
jgi:hypothetical protein